MIDLYAGKMRLVPTLQRRRTKKIFYRGKSGFASLLDACPGLGQADGFAWLQPRGDGWSVLERQGVETKMTNGDNIIRLSGGLDTIPSKLLSAANFWRRSGNSYYRRHFRISVTDVRILTFLQARGPVSLNAMADHCGIDKTQGSRAVKELIGRKLVVHNRSAAKGPVGLSLDRDGVLMCRKLKPASVARQKLLAAGFSSAEIEQLDRMLDVLLGNARASLLGDAGEESSRPRKLKQP